MRMRPADPPGLCRPHMLALPQGMYGSENTCFKTSIVCCASRSVYVALDCLIDGCHGPLGSSSDGQVRGTDA